MKHDVKSCLSCGQQQSLTSVTLTADKKPYMSQAMPQKKTKPKPKPKAKTANGRVDVGSIRHKLGLTQQQFASLLGLSTVSVSRWEHAHTHPTDTSRALLTLLERALKKRDAEVVRRRLESIPGNNEESRIIELVHLGD
ncbi:putative XRE family transcriptional regulator [Virus Rctr197k]|nr:putative XRE family transcriptional regulator [Virus Rctr197k]